MCFTETLCPIENVSALADTRIRSWGIDTFSFISRTDVFQLALIDVRASQPIAHVTQVTHTLVSRR